ncbi:uncharacterized protein SPAPADRAFT_58224 [Spathaspora passalidarum NRRL Y-27907]|uniref:GATA-type domain-containing protein n=1 Tax=Spathaspora passalidarum (strain NRRL Y-27907 / 11-Y1) TaxID=619300 RepID=G3AFU5_SPAPN|nr:uncharacterized protein SPAPADRAFT_58224 [Spathaspora passalidarum NRRL Y-27907]EGW35084.1 hypothetical protein SPAPADRAFT_58224 [Spathaspora passalidarum NRRL Y-27907]
MTTTVTNNSNPIRLPSIKELTGSSPIGGTLPLPLPLTSNDNGIMSPPNGTSGTTAYSPNNTNYTSSHPISVVYQKVNSPSLNGSAPMNLHSVSYDGTTPQLQPQPMPTFYYPPPQQQPQPPQQQIYYYVQQANQGLQPNPQQMAAAPHFYTLPEVVSKPVHRCHRCGTTETPEWRRGPRGARTLCNACGLVHTKLVKKKGAALAAEEVLNNKVLRGKNGRRISIKKYLMNESQKQAKAKGGENVFGNISLPSVVLGNIPPQQLPMMVGNIPIDQRISLPPPHTLSNTPTYYHPC